MNIIEEINAQREIGKQILLMRILKSEDERVQRTGVNSVTKEDVIGWTLMSREKVDELCRAYRTLRKSDLAMMAAVEYKNSFAIEIEKETFYYVYNSYNNLDDHFLDNYSPQFLDEFCRINAELNYATYVDSWHSLPREDLNHEDFFRKIIDNYLRCLVTEVEGLRSKGYDWDVISEMIWCGISRDNYDALSEVYSVA